MNKELPVRYIEAEEWALLFLKRMKAFKKRYEKDEEFRRYLEITGGAENAALKRTSMDLSKALVKLRNR